MRLCKQPYAKALKPYIYALLSLAFLNINEETFRN